MYKVRLRSKSKENIGKDYNEESNKIDVIAETVWSTNVGAAVIGSLDVISSEMLVCCTTTGYIKILSSESGLLSTSGRNRMSYKQKEALNA